MGITPRFDPAVIARKFDAVLDFINEETVKALTTVGEMAVKYAREIPDPAHGGRGFKDHTANLRSSIGFAVYYNGTQITGAFGSQAAGAGEGQKLADKAAEGTRGYALVVTAGMYYAVYVESKGRDVLTSAEQRAAEWLSTELADIRKAIIEELSKI